MAGGIAPAKTGHARAETPRAAAAAAARASINERPLHIASGDKKKTIKFTQKAVHSCRR